MLRSLYAGISGLQGHQAMMDVIGNNIANVNTVGFKSSRMTFQDALSQTMSFGNGPTGLNGGVNPMQIGLGMKIGSIDTNFGQGVMQTTGMVTDLAIEGEGFFVVNDGNTNKYTRAGAFQIDAEGNLLAQGGKYFVQGRMADAEGNLVSGTPISNIRLPFGEKFPAQATDEMKFHCNLDASADAEANVLSADWGMRAQTPDSIDLDVDTTPVDLASGQTFRIETSDITGTAGDITIPENSSSDTISELVTALNAAIRTNSNLANKVEAVANSSNNGIIFRTKTPGGLNTEITVSSGTGATPLDVTLLGLTSGTPYNGTQQSTLINDLPFVTTDLNDGDIIKISGANPDGSPVTITFTYVTDGTTVQDLLNRINEAFTGATATLDEKGRLVLTDAIPGKSKSAISLSFSDVDTSGSAAAMPSFGVTQEGEDAGSHTASIYVYDSLGNKHTVEVKFTKNMGEDNYWNWEATVNGGETAITSGGTGFVTFNDDGSIARMEAFDGEQLSFAPGRGADTMEITLNGGASGTFSGITQYSSPFTTIVSEQNGYTMGILSNVYFDNTGKIIGEYTNGQNRNLAQVAMATFNNEGGLLKAGDNLYQASTNSGQAAVGMAGEQIAANIQSKYLEASNVDLSKELTDMIITQRGYQANTKVITTVDTMLEELIQRVKR